MDRLVQAVAYEATAEWRRAAAPLKGRLPKPLWRRIMTATGAGDVDRERAQILWALSKFQVREGRK